MGYCINCNHCKEVTSVDTKFYYCGAYDDSEDGFIDIVQPTGTCWRFEEMETIDEGN